MVSPVPSLSRRRRGKGRPLIAILVRLFSQE
jgi:hypothetical protein